MLALRLNKQKKQKRRKEGRKPKVKKNYKGTGFRIVDDEDPFSHGFNKADESDDEGVEELPQIASVVDERPVEVQALEEFQKGKWKHMESTTDTSVALNPSSSNSSRMRHDSDGDLSPVRPRQRHDSDGDDMSPPRARQRHDSGDVSPPRQRRRHDSGDTSVSLPRTRQRHDSGDMSPPRQRRRDSDGSDLSPPRAPSSSRNSSKSNKDRDSSPPRRPNNRHHQGSRRSIANPEVVEGTKGLLPGTTLEGKKAGLQRAADLRNEMVDYRRKENEMFENLDDEISGRRAKTKLRDRNTGKERDLVAEFAKKEEEDRIAAEKKKQYDKWGKGLKQVEAQSARVNEAMHEISKPMARYANDQDLDDYLKVQDRDGDPMLKFLRKKGNSGKPTYSGPPPPPNRFAILPGYRWDGVDRSNGYEREWFSHINAKKALQEEAYKWSVEDL